MTRDAALRSASRRATRIYESPKFRRAYIRGAAAALAGHPPETCPYRRDPNGTWRGVWRNAWLRGHASIQRDREADR